MPNRKILIVDDSASRAERLQAVVSEAGFTAVCVTTHAEAVERARIEKPQLILIDVVVPEADGYEACRQLRNDMAVRHVPVIAVASARTPADELWARMQGASDLVSKPYSAAELLDAIRTALV